MCARKDALLRVGAFIIARRYIYADLRDLAPLFIQVGAVETLLDDAIRLAGVAGAAHVPVTLEVWPEMVHVWHLYHPDLAAGRRAIEAGGRFLRGAMSGAMSGAISGAMSGG
jgi:monoterpene epsilon-lactone hydrolase